VEASTNTGIAAEKAFSMASIFSPRHVVRPARIVPHARSLSRQMTLHVAGAVIAFAVVQIWAVTSAVGMGQSRLLPVVALAILLFAALPIARRIERQWHRLGQSALPSVGLYQRFRREVRRLWLVATLFPAAWVGLVVFANEAIAATL
jgi:hypothetical protein